MRYASKSRSLTALLLLLFVGAMAAANFLTPDKPFSESENRVLDERPDFSLHSLLSGQFTSDYESYTSDQFAFRDAWVGAKTGADRALGKKDSNGVFLGKDGYLLEQYDSPSDADLEDRVRAIQTFDHATPGLRKYVMLAPTAASLLSNKLPAYAPVGDGRADLDRIRRLLPQPIRFVDVYSALYAEREQPIFYKTDHHWTTEGAYYAYRELCRQMGIVPQDQDSFDVRQVTDEFYGSLYSKSGFRRLQPDRIDLYLPKTDSKIKVSYADEGLISDSLYEPDHLRKKDKYAVFLNGNHALIRIATDGPADKKLLVVKDSYANSLIPFLTKHFGEIDVVDLRYYDEPLLKLVQERQFQDMLILYNLKTFFEDPSILNVTEGMP
ncbi:DHHW family protein [Paenibacillaceae bacterium WGS1546]|uniref:DHHW family protein n=1 Tax=Cohnella sp. WGS1546 TaxID=3366810 RepID=UPI00372D62EB